MLTKLKKFTNLPLSRKLQFLSSTYHKLKTQTFYKMMFKSMGAKSIIKKPMFLTPEYISVGNACYIWNDARIEAITSYANDSFNPHIILEDGVTIQQRCHLTAAYSGNYRIIYAFSYQWKKLLLEYAPTLGFDLIIMEKIFKKSVLKDLFPRLLKISIKNRIDKTSKEYEYLSYGIDNFWFGSFIKFVISKFSIFNLRIVNKVFNIFKISNLNTIIKEQK